MTEKLEIPCSYQGGKQRLAKQIVDIFYAENEINDETKFYDLCCGSGAVSLELINRGFNPNNITMIDNGCFGQFWQDIANDEFELKVFREEINKLPSLENIQSYLKELSNQPVDKDKMVYHYLLLQAGAFGSKQIWIEDNKWKNNTFRNYWMPTETSSRRSPVNPMMPMPDTLYDRVETIVNYAKGINAACCDAFDVIKTINDMSKVAKVIVYIDPPYQNTEKYHTDLDYATLIADLHNCKVVLSEAKPMVDCDKSEMVITRNPKKGNISGNTTKNNRAEWLNIYNK